MMDFMLRQGQIIDAFQTLTLAVIAGAVVYIVIRLERSLRLASGSLTDVLTGIARNAKRLDQIEVQLDIVERQVQGAAQGGSSQGGGAKETADNDKKPPARS
jgi:hypothetical protein